MKRFNKQILEAIDRGIYLALDDFEEQSNEPIAPKKDVIKRGTSIKWVIDNFVDLGLPSGTLWGKYNLGVDFKKYQMDLVPNWFGDYYAWGEIEPKENYTWETYKFNRGQNKVGMSLIKYCNNTTYGFGDKHTVLEDQDNVVKQKFSKDCDLPTYEQVTELCNNTSVDWTEDYQGIEGLSGNIVRSNINGNEIFFPDTGHYQGDSADLHDGPELWTKDFVPTDNQAIQMYLGTGIDAFAAYRCLGMPVRPVLNR